MSFKGRNHLLAISAMAVPLSLSGCLGSDGSDGADGQPAGPQISNVSVLGNPVPAGGQVEVHVSAESAEDNDLAYDWQFPEGWEEQMVEDGMAILTAPEQSAERGRLEVQVSDGDATRTASVQLATIGTTIDSFSAQAEPAWEPGADVDIATQVFSTEASAITYQYAFGGKSLDENSPVWTWSVPDLLPGVYELSVTATGADESLAGSASVEQTVKGSDPWPMFGGNVQRTGSNPINTGPVEEPSVEWAQSVDGASVPDIAAIGGTIGFVPVIDREGRVYLHLDDNDEDGGLVVALDSEGESGDSELWRAETGNPPLASPLLTSSGELYTVTENEVLVFEAGDDENLLWSQNFEIEQPSGEAEKLRTIPGLTELPDGQVLFSVSLDSGPTLISLEEGPDESTVWSFTGDTGGSISAPTVGPDGVVYVGLADTMYALDPDPAIADESERVIWSQELDGHLFAPLLGEDDMLYVVSNEEGYMIDAATGEFIWTTEDAGSSSVSVTDGVANAHPVFANGQILTVGQSSPAFLSVNPRTGTLEPDDPDTADLEEFGIFWALNEDAYEEDEDPGRVRMTMDAAGIVYAQERETSRILAIDTSLDLGGIDDPDRILWDLQLPEQDFEGQVAVGDDGTLYVVTKEVRVLRLE